MTPSERHEQSDPSSLGDDRPESPWCRVLRLRRSGRIEEALEALGALPGEPGEPHGSTRKLRAALLGELAEHLFAQGEGKRAETTLRQALALAPGFPDLHHRLGLLHRARGEREPARAAFRNALAAAPRYAAPVWCLAVLDAEAGELGEAIRALERLRRRLPPTRPATFEEGLAALRRGDWEEAERRVEGAYRGGPGLRRELARAGRLLAEGRALEAHRTASALARRHGDYADVHHLVGLTCAALEWWDDGLEAYRRSLLRNPDFHQARVDLACVLFVLGESRRAEAELDRVLLAEPGHEGVRHRDGSLRRPPRESRDAA